MTTNKHDDQDENCESPRQLARQRVRRAGERSTSAAHTLMRLSKPLLDGLALDDDLREVVDKARRMTSHGASRREERRLAGALRQIDLDDLETRLSNLQKGGQADVHLFQLAETWRTRLIEGGADAAEAFFASGVGVDQAKLTKFIAEARREQTTGRPRGAARTLFRQVMAALHEADQRGKTSHPND